MIWAINCISCEHQRRVENQAEAEETEFDACPKCGEDLGMIIRMEPCPNGITGEMWESNRHLEKTHMKKWCDSEHHHWKSGMHTFELER